MSKPADPAREMARFQALDKARSMLFVNGYLTDAENAKVMQRMDKDVAAAGLPTERVSMFDVPQND